jgi:myo-inositol 2-dehydrogenase/D-chiro-inositol 1-dehydrogenase
MSRGAGGRVRLGIIGLGTVAQAVHLPLLSRHRDRFEVTAVCDLSAELAAVVTGRFGLGAAERCRTAEELLDGGRVDAVLVLSSGSHGEVAGAALARGVAVFCESRWPTPCPRRTSWPGCPSGPGHRCSSGT